ncbi:Brain protein I3 [Armadillidium nasatum]|uniref:Membrane protein BRI3 n=1 Tax=Armadillidium nasatum TaxID=96803 RepID=A0A5N5TPQ3_9CRUS|nr:Brain protein I3 [Armadillidium nasatum]
MTDKPPSYNPNFYPDPPPPYQSSNPPPPPPPQSTAYVGTSTGSTTYIHTTTQPSYGAIPIVIQPVRAADVIVVGGCPACRVGVLDEEFTLPGLCCAFWFFPIGVLCCLAMRERRCTNCGAIFS